MDFAAHLAAQTSRLPGQVAVSVRESGWTLSAVQDALGSMARALGDVAGMRALVVLPDSFVAYLSHLYFFLGQGTLVPLSVGSPTAYLEGIKTRVRPHVIVTTPSLYTRHRPLFADVDALILEPAEASAPRLTWQRAGQAPRMSVPGGVRVVLFTSGSTGVPKGVCLSEDNLLAAARMNVSILSLDEGRRSLVTVPLYDYYGLIQIYSHLLAGAGLCLGESVSFVADLAKRLHRNESTDLVGVPHGLRKVFAAEGGARPLPTSLTRVTSSSEMLSEDVLELIFAAGPDLTVVNIFGLTEAGRACRREIRRGDAASRSIGWPAPGVEIRTDRTPGTPGELVIRGPNVMLGYLSEVTPEGEIRFEPCHEVRTGDIGYVDPGGEVFLLGRRDHLMNLKGVKVHPADIEVVALKTPGVEDARAYLNGVLCLDVVSRRAGNEDVLPAVRAALRAALPGYCQPGEVRLVDEIARTELGSKTLRS